jgi:addiction module antitoxin, RelB/DinJ family
MVNLQVKIDDKLNTDAKAVAASIGMDVNTAVRIFLKQFVRENGLPFRPVGDPFFSPANMAHLEAAARDMDAGRNIVTQDLADLAREE